MLAIRKNLKRFCLAVTVLVAVQLLIYYSYKIQSDLPTISKSIVDVEVIEKISWENVTFIEYEKSRTGPGEHSKPFELTDPEDIKKNEVLFRQEGFYVVVSDKISVNRALADFRPETCSKKKYLRRLPTVSVIITFHNEVWSVLLRCVHSILNRSPKGLLREIILINDKSTFPELYEPLQKYFNGTFDSKVKIHNNEERQGLIKARMTGAKLAKGGAIIFLDSHMEVGTTWLPPLLEPLVYHPTFATVPVVDGMNHAKFTYDYTGNGYRGTFDWTFRYQWLPRKLKEGQSIEDNYELSSMTGGAYAILRKHFFHLGGYDEELKIWNGENYELSLKLWLCSGGIFTVPCSRIVHLSKIHSAYRIAGDGSDFVARNLKRVAEVWMDDYKKYLYQTEQARYDAVDAGNLTKQFELKKNLNCKPFKYFLDVVAPEMLQRYPLEPTYFAEGAIQNLGLQQCIRLREYDTPWRLDNCSPNLENPDHGLDFTLTMEKSIRYNDTNDQCLSGERVSFFNCFHMGGEQYFFFNLTSRQIIYKSREKCLSGISANEKVVLADCNETEMLQKWKWGKENVTALNNWDTTGVKY